MLLICGWRQLLMPSWWYWCKRDGKWKSDFLLFLIVRQHTAKGRRLRDDEMTIVRILEKMSSVFAFAYTLNM